MESKDSEKMLERTFSEKVNKSGKGWCIKLMSTFIKGLPDRAVFLKGGFTLFVEFKTEGKKPSAMQDVIHGKLRELGFEVFVVDSVEKRDIVLTHINDKYFAGNK